MPSGIAQKDVLQGSMLPPRGQSSLSEGCLLELLRKMFCGVIIQSGKAAGGCPGREIFDTYFLIFERPLQQKAWVSLKNYIQECD